MVKVKLVFVCSECGEEHAQWQGQCKSCKVWNSLKELTTPNSTKKASHLPIGYSGAEVALTPLKDVKEFFDYRYSSSVNELDIALGGGIVMGGVVIIGGAPGIGKSTLLLQIAMNLSQKKRILYVSGEESLAQISMRAKRLKLYSADLQLLSHTNIEDILSIAQRYRPEIMIIDSIQTMYLPNNSGEPGGISQIRDSATALTRYAKQNKCSVFLIGHVTKSGEVAGPKVLEHIVDTVLYFDGQTDSRYRTIRAIKNRYGAANEIGVFVMSEKGLLPVKNPSAIFLNNSTIRSSGSIIMSIWEASRTILVELQALVNEVNHGMPRRVSIGQDQHRLSMLLAVLNRHVGMQMNGMDVYLNVVGGIKVNETASDLPSLLAILSSFQNKIIPKDLLCFGEVGLSGEIRPVTSGLERINEAQKQGFKIIIAPVGNLKKNVKLAGVKLYPVSTLNEATNVINNCWTEV